MRNLKLYDILRFDHFRGFTAYWQIPATLKTAKNGRWIRSPTRRFFKALKSAFPKLPFVAENLGFISERVQENLRLLGVPGMSVLLFGFDGSNENSNAPVNYIENSVVYTGTHDTNTARGWFVEDATEEQKAHFFKLVGKEVSEMEVSWVFIKLALASKSNLCIIPLQDLLVLGSEARMNHPGKREGNWDWRVRIEQLKSEGFMRLDILTGDSGRSVKSSKVKLKKNQLRC